MYLFVYLNNGWLFEQVFRDYMEDDLLFTGNTSFSQQRAVVIQGSIRTVLAGEKSYMSQSIDNNFLITCNIHKCGVEHVLCE